MPKSKRQKLKLLYIAKLLMQKSDEEHTFSVQEIIDYLAAQDISAERKSIYHDLELLRSFGIDIISRKDSKTGYYIGSRDFELPELKLLVDSVQSSKFITEKKTLSLIGKLEKLTSEHGARGLHRQVFVQNRVKTMNESVYLAINEIHTAILEDKTLRFKYFDYTITKARKFRKNGDHYEVSPFALVWEDENYYMAAWDNAAGKIKHYRVSKMTEVSVGGLPREGLREFKKLDMAQYQKRYFGMFGGDMHPVRMRCENSLVGAVIDRFGKEIIIAPDGEEHFVFTADICVSPVFFGWVCTFGGGIEILSPESVRRDFKKHIAKLAAAHK